MKTLNAFAQFVIFLSLPLLLGGCGEPSTPYDPIPSPTATDANDSFDAIDFEDNETLNRIIAEAIEDVVKFGDYHGSLPEAEIKKLARSGADMRGTTGFELYFAPNMQKPYTGWVKRFYKNGRLRSLDQYKDGIRHGRGAHWYDDGEFRGAGIWENGNPVWD
jgi:hypothetical protein